MRLTDFLLLLLEEDPAQLARTEQAVRDAGLDGRLRVLRGREDAINFFTRFLADRSPIRTSPSLFLFDLDKPSGLELLEWLQNHPPLRKMIKVGLFTAPDGPISNRAYELGVNSCLARPATAEGLASMFGSIRQYWALLNNPPQL